MFQLAACFVIAFPLFLQDKPAEKAQEKIVPGAKAKDFANRKMTVEFTVKSSRFLADRDMVFLNSESNHRNENNFTAVIFKDGLERFSAMEIENPAEHYKNKKVRVTGRIEMRDGKPQIRLIDPDQIKIVETDKKAKPESEPKRPRKSEDPSTN